MRKNRCLMAGLMGLIILVAFITQGSSKSPGHKLDPEKLSDPRTSTVTLLNPALFHRLNTVLEHGLLQGD